MCVLLHPLSPSNRSVSSVGLERLLDRQEVTSSNLVQITTARNGSPQGCHSFFPPVPIPGPGKGRSPETGNTLASNQLEILQRERSNSLFFSLLSASSSSQLLPIVFPTSHPLRRRQKMAGRKGEEAGPEGRLRWRRKREGPPTAKEKYPAPSIPLQTALPPHLAAVADAPSAERADLHN